MILCRVLAKQASIKKRRFVDVAFEDNLFIFMGEGRKVLADTKRGH